MKGKLGLVLGFGIGYVLGSRAGRQRYEQIKKTASSVWNSDPVQRVSGQVGGWASDKAEAAQNYVAGKTRSLLHAATAPKRSEDLSVQPTDDAGR